MNAAPTREPTEWAPATGWAPVPGALAAWKNPAGLLLFPRYAVWTLRRPDGTETAHYRLIDALRAAER